MVRGAVMHNFMEPLKIESLKLKPLREGEIVVKLVASGVCHSDLSVVQAKLPVPPRWCSAMKGRHRRGGRQRRDRAQEGGSRRAGMGRELRQVPLLRDQQDPPLRGCGAVGDDGAGSRLRTERHGRLAHGRCRLVADHTIVRATSAIKIREDVPLDRACLVGCGVMTGVGAAINTAKVRPGQTVAVFGCGGVGLNVIQGAALAGARVSSASTSPPRSSPWRNNSAPPTR